MNKSHIKSIKEKQQQKDIEDHKKRYKVACDNAVEQKQQREISENKKKSFKLQHLFASMIFGFITGILVMFSVNQLKSKKEEKNPLVSQKIEKQKNKITINSSIDPAIMQYKGITQKATQLIPKKKAIVIPIEKKISINRKFKYSPFTGLNKVAKTPEELRRQKIRDLQKRVKNATKRKKYIKPNSKTNKKKNVNQGLEELKTKKKKQKQNEKHLNNSLPPDIAAEMRK